MKQEEEKGPESDRLNDGDDRLKGNLQSGLRTLHTAAEIKGVVLKQVGQWVWRDDRQESRVGSGNSETGLMIVDAGLGSDPWLESCTGDIQQNIQMDNIQRQLDRRKCNRL